MLPYILIYLGIIVFGVYLMRQQQKKIQHTRQLLKEFVPTVDTTIDLGREFKDFTMLDRFKENGKDFITHIKGNDRQSAIKHILIFVVALAAAFYCNMEFLQLNPFLVLPAVGMMALYGIYIMSKKKLRREFEESFSEALNIISSAVSVGNTVISGIEECAVKLDGTIIGRVFKRVSKRLDIGEETETVLLDSYQELHYREYFFFIISVVINMRGGGQVKEIMSRISQIISNSRVMERKKYAKTSEARMSVKILAAIPIFMFFLMKVISPENFDILINDDMGHIILYYVICSTAIGLWIIWSMMNRI